MNVLMPQLGETVAEGLIVRWAKHVGDRVEAGEVLFEIESDKTTMDVPALGAGTLAAIRADVGQSVAVGSVVAVIDDATAAGVAPESSSAAHSERPMATESTQDATIDPFHGVRTPMRDYGKARTARGVEITPLARRLAAGDGIDPSDLQGSGPNGRIVAADVRRAGTAGVKAEPDGDSFREMYAGVPLRELPLDAMRKTIARRLTASKQNVPHFYLTAHLNVDALLELRRQISAASGHKVSLNDLIVKAYALALREVAAANVAWAGDRLLQFERVDVGVAVAVAGGLVTPIVRDAGVKPLLELGTELAELIARARERRLQPAEYTGGAGSVSNLGMYGVSAFQAIVNPPQATILAVGAAERRAIETADGSLRAATMMTISLSVDHRAVDGAVGAELLAALRTCIESPYSLVV